jgi:four helix bundle protein
VNGADRSISREIGHVKGFEALEIWQLAHQLTLDVYRASARFPEAERFGSTNQLRRASASVGANIAEGYGRHNSQDTIRFLYVARGSLMETRNFVLLARDLDYLDPDAASALIIGTTRLSVKITNTVSALSRAKSLREPLSEYIPAGDTDNLITT